MCLIAFALDAHPRYRLLLAANRDEFHQRPALAAHWWNDAPDVYGGRDLDAGGTWLAIDRHARLAALTNFRERPYRGAGERSRGELGASFLRNTTPAHLHAEGLLPDVGRYGGFNLLLFDLFREQHSGVYLTNRDESRPLQSLTPGLHTLSNHLLDSRWPKSLRLRQALESALNEADPFEPLFDALSDRTPVSAAEFVNELDSDDPDVLTRTPFIFDARYGTRASTVVAVTHDGTLRFAERSWRWASEAPVFSGERRLEFNALEKLPSC